MSPRTLIAGNWKMNLMRGEAGLLAVALADHMRSSASDAEMVVCPPTPLLDTVAAKLAGTPLGLGGQDCHAESAGAHTGDVSAEMLRDAGCGFVTVGHSERRADHDESDGLVRAKAEAAHRAGLIAIVCVGETEAERDAGRAVDVVTSQIAGSLPEASTAANTVIAYEPVWAIGTGRTPTLDDIAEMHAAMRARLGDLMTDSDAVRLLYGGSVKPSNADEILAIANVNGALVGGASLKAEDFIAIHRAAG